MMVRLGLGLGLTSLSWASTALIQGEIAVNCKFIVCGTSFDSFDLRAVHTMVVQVERLCD
jgi:hypothetical protein